MDLKLKNKVVLISGSSQGLGRVIAEEYLAEGSRVCLCARRKEPLSRAEEELKQKFGNDDVRSIAVNLTAEEEVQKCAEFVESEFGGLDILVANVGSGRGKEGVELTRKDWDQSLGLNLVSPALLIASSLRLLKKNRGNIVLISSIAGREALPAAPVSYSAAKLGLLAITKNYSRWLADDDIRINMVCPGNILMPDGVWERKLSEDQQSVEAYIKCEVPLKRFASAKEVANAVLFLSSSVASFITGTSLTVDGGQTRGFQ